MQRRTCYAFALVALAIGTAGCGDPTSSVSGEVTVDGAPLEKGVISFNALEGKAASNTVEVLGGKYRAETTPGKKQVQISAPVVTGKRKEYEGPGAQWVEITSERLPERYNSKSELTAELAAGSNSKDFKLTTKK